MTVNVKKFLTEVEAIASEEPAYKLGHYGQDGLCDCIGLIIGAIRRAGGEWRGTHGSNYAARKEVVALHPIYGSGELQPGEVVFKAYEPNQGGYNLPAKYLPGGESYTGDLRDYYHVGVVISSAPLRIRHMTTPKPKMDTKLGKWSFHGMLKKVNMQEEEPGTMERVIISGGDVSAPIRMRKAASTGASVVAEIPQGSEAVLLEGGGVWNQIAWMGQSGYVMSKFVNRPGASDGNMVSVPEAELEKIYDLIGDWLGRRG